MKKRNLFERWMDQKNPHIKELIKAIAKLVDQESHSKIVWETTVSRFTYSVKRG